MSQFISPYSGANRLLSLLHLRNPQYHPIISIHEISEIASEVGDLKLAFECHRTMLKYIEPELKSVDVKVTNPADNAIRVTLFDEVESVPFDEL